MLFLAGVAIVVIISGVFIIGHLATKASTGGATTTFSGTVDATNNGCAYDDTCSVTVDGKVIVTGGGLSSNPEGNVYGSSAAVKIGDKVHAKAIKTPNLYTLQGCSSCYIKLQ